MEEVRINTCKGNTRTKTLMFALVVIAFGVAWLLKNMEMLDPFVEDIIFSWPMIIVAVGVLNINRYSWPFAILIMLFGSFFILADVYNWNIRFNDVFWPSLLILVGLGLVYGSYMIYRRKRLVISNSTEHQIEEVSIFGGSVKRVASQEFRGGDIVNIFGGSKIDMTQANLADGVHELNFVSVFGGGELLIPSNWHVKVEVVSIFGDFNDKRGGITEDTSKTLVIKGVTIFGGGEIKSF